MDGLSDEALRKEIEAMRVKQIKEELDKLGQAHADAFEKDDLVQRLIDARRQAGEGAQEGAGPTRQQIRDGTELFANDPDSASVMRALEANPALQAAAMDIAANGDVSKYANDPEVMYFMRKLEVISKRGMS